MRDDQTIAQAISLVAGQLLRIMDAFMGGPSYEDDFRSGRWVKGMLWTGSQLWPLQHPLQFSSVADEADFVYCMNMHFEFEPDIEEEDDAIDPEIENLWLG